MLPATLALLIARVFQPMLQVLRARLGAGLKVTGPGLTHVVRADDSVRLCIHQRDAGRLRSLDTGARCEEASSDFAARGLRLLVHWRRGKDKVSTFRCLDHLVEQPDSICVATPRIVNSYS
jgi:hypothetical protein